LDVFIDEDVASKQLSFNSFRKTLSCITQNRNNFLTNIFLNLSVLKNFGKKEIPKR
jgi:hypothetical protein